MSRAFGSSLLDEESEAAKFLAHLESNRGDGQAKNPFAQGGKFFSSSDEEMEADEMNGLDGDDAIGA